MTVQDMIDFLRLNVHIQDKNGEVESDENYLSMSDNDLRLFFNVTLARDNWDYTLETLPKNMVYPLVLLTKRELFVTLAVKVAPEYDLTADQNNQLKEDQKFKHYMALVREIDLQYQEYLLTSDGAGANTLKSFDVLLTSRYYTKRNYDKGIAPALSINLHRIYRDSVEVSWIPKNVNRLLHYKVYVSIEPIYDMFGRDIVINPKSRLCAVITDSHNVCCRITGLAPKTFYYLAVQVVERNGLTGVSEVNFMTESR